MAISNFDLIAMCASPTKTRLDWLLNEIIISDGIDSIRDDYSIRRSLSNQSSAIAALFPEMELFIAKNLLHYHLSAIVARAMRQRALLRRGQ